MPPNFKLPIRNTIQQSWTSNNYAENAVETTENGLKEVQEIKFTIHNTTEQGSGNFEPQAREMESKTRTY